MAVLNTARELGFESGYGHVIDLVVKLFDLSSYETEEELAKKIIKEALRVMKPDGELVVTEWERSDNFIKKIFSDRVFGT